MSNQVKESVDGKKHSIYVQYTKLLKDPSQCMTFPVFCNLLWGDKLNK